jgi:hypothetical protein
MGRTPIARHTRPQETLVNAAAPARPSLRPTRAIERATNAATIHEAGHTVVCFILYGEHVVKGLALVDDAQPGIPTYSLMPVPTSCRPPAGVPRRGTPAPVSVDGIVDAYGVMTYAGLAAESLWTSNGEPRRARPAPPDLEMSDLALRDRSLADRGELQRLASLVGAERQAVHFYREYWEEALRLLRANWAAVEELADLLAEHRSLNGERIDDLLRQHCPL